MGRPALFPLPDDQVRAIIAAVDALEGVLPPRGALGLSWPGSSRECTPSPGGWRPHVDASGVAYPLNHLHPFRYDLPIAHAAVEAVFVEISVAFAMHCFTRARVDGDDSSRLYVDDRETLAFCYEWYAYSQRLPGIARTLSARRCGYAKDKNYVTVDVPTPSGVAGRYGVFFNVIRIKGDDGRAVLLTVQSAYELSAGKQLSGQGSIKFARLVELTLQGIKPRPLR